jgi:hypothetical protein
MDTATLDTPTSTQSAPAPAAPLTLELNQPVIVRARDAGVHFGLYQGHSGREVTIAKSRRLYYWFAARSITLSAVAAYGIDPNKSKIGAEVELTVLLEACEIIPATDEAAATIREAPVAPRG